jgi:hypothetical protein
MRDDFAQREMSCSGDVLHDLNVGSTRRITVHIYIVYRPFEPGQLLAVSEVFMKTSDQGRADDIFQNEMHVCCVMIISKQMADQEKV